MDAEGVDHPHLLPPRRNGPGNFVVLGKLNPVKVHHAPERAVLLSHIQGPGLQSLAGVLRSGIASPKPVGIGGALILLVENRLVNLPDSGQVGGGGFANHGNALLSL